MVEYLCYRCGYVGKQKIHLKNHLNRKNVCKPVLDDIDVEEIKKFYDFEILEDLLQIAPNCSKIAPKLLQIAPFCSKIMNLRRFVIIVKEHTLETVI